MTHTTTSTGEFVSLFDGSTLDGWRAVPRSYGSLWPGGPDIRTVLPELAPDYDEMAVAHPAHWEVVDGVIEGFQDPALGGYGGYLVTDRAFGDFELQLEMKPDWPADTGVMLRRRPDSWHGIQVLVDHRKSGSIGGFFGNGIGSFHAVPFVLDVSTDGGGVPTGLIVEDPATTLEPMTPDKPALLTGRGDPQAFLDRWRFGDWNSLRIRCAGARPTVTTWVNDVFVAEIDLATLDAEHYDTDDVAALLGPSGHIALEVHDNDPWFGERRWGRGARCRWRNIAIRELTPDHDLQQASPDQTGPSTMPIEPDFTTFTHDEAWRLGSALVDTCRAEQLPVTISIHLGEQRVFHAALPGTSADNDDWVMRKTRIVRRFGRSSHDIGETLAADDPARFLAVFALPAADYAPAGGAVPIRVNGTMVGVLAISGLPSDEDHQRAMAALHAAATGGGAEQVR